MPGIYDGLSTLELRALAATLRSGRRRARAAALRSRSLRELRQMMALIIHLAALEHEVSQALASR
jgi:hypothetical protein